MKTDIKDPVVLDSLPKEEYFSFLGLGRHVVSVKYFPSWVSRSTEATIYLDSYEERNGG